MQQQEAADYLKTLTPAMRAMTIKELARRERQDQTLAVPTKPQPK
jgi:hypothetical protein